MDIYEAAIATFQGARTEAQQSATEWGYHANNNPDISPARKRECLERRAVAIYIRDILDAVIKAIEKQRELDYVLTPPKPPAGATVLVVSDRMAITEIRKG